MIRRDRKTLFQTLSQQLKYLFVSIRFLTIIPCCRADEDETDHFKMALFYFGITGLIIGTIAAILSVFSLWFFPMSVTAALLVIFLSLMSGFIHIDGLADTADGFLSGKPKKDCLDIMRDSRIGVMGAVAIVSVFLIKYSALSVINPENLFKILLLVPIAGRTAIVFSMAVLPYARKDGGLGEIFYSSVTRKAAIFSLLFITVISMVIDLSLLVPILFSVFFTTVVFSLICKRKIGGATGDTLGAVCEMTEAIALITVTIKL